MDIIHQIKKFDSNRILFTETYDVDKFAELNKKNELPDNEIQKLIDALCQNN